MEQERCAEAKRFQQIDNAFRKGDLEALRAAVEDPALVPNGRMPHAIGNCLVYAIYHSPLPFIRALLEIGADPNLPVDDGFPPLIAALSCARDVQGRGGRPDVNEILRLLLKFGADPNQRGINDCTPLHLAVATRDQLAIQRLLDAGADPELPTRIDASETPLQMAQVAGLPEIEEMLARKGKAMAPASAAWVIAASRRARQRRTSTPAAQLSHPASYVAESGRTGPLEYRMRTSRQANSRGRGGDPVE
jgi:uncharacterized protein